MYCGQGVLGNKKDKSRMTWVFGLSKYRRRAPLKRKLGGSVVSVFVGYLSGYTQEIVAYMDLVHK